MSLVLGLPLDMHLCGSSSNGPRLPTFLKLLQNPHILLTCGKAPPKVVRDRQFFTLLTSKCASHQNGVQLFHHLSFHRGSENGVLCPFWLENICASRHIFFIFSTSESAPNMVFCAFWLRSAFRATTAYNFSSPIPPNGSALAALASLLFDPPEPQTIGKHTVVHDFSTLTLSLLGSFFLLLLFSSLIPSHLCFSSFLIVGSLTSKHNH